MTEGLSRWLAAISTGAARHVRLVLAANAVVTVVLAVITVGWLGVNMDNKRLLAPDLPFQRAAAAFQRYFPSLDDALLIVVDASSGPAAHDAADRLRDRLARETEWFRSVYVPGGGDFFERVGLLYRTPDELQDFADHIAQVQPVLADLAQQPTIANLADVLREGFAQRERASVRDEDWTAVLDRVGEATVRVFQEYPLAISWDELLISASPFGPGSRQVVVAEPVLEFDRLLAAAGPLEAIRQAAAELQLDPAHGVRVRITGNPALNYEEMLGLAWDVGIASLVSFTIVAGLLFLAFRSLRLVAAAAITLVVGLVWTAGFATLAVGKLNLLSIAFGVLFIGLGVDFAIHLGMHWVDRVRAGLGTVDAIEASVREVGGSLLLCTVTTAIGFYSFVPTDYLGVAELGLIAGTGMIVILTETLTLFPALMVALLGAGPDRPVRAPLRVRLAPPAFVGRHPLAVVLIAAAAGAGSAVLLWDGAWFDSNVVAMRDPGTESVQAFEDLLEQSGTSPWYADVLETNLDAAEAAAKRLQALPEVSAAVTLADYVPTDQDEKREILADTALMLDVPPGSAKPAALPVEEQIAALRKLRDELGKAHFADPGAPLARSVAGFRDQLDVFLGRLDRHEDPAAVLAELQSLLLAGFPKQMARLRRALEPPRVTRADLPSELALRMLAPDGHARVQVFPAEVLDSTPKFTRFVDAVRSIEPEATGVSVNLVEFGRATVRSLQEAILLALALITLLLLVLWRRIRETLLVLAPLVLAGVLTGGTMVLVGMPFNFVNVVVLPLLLGIGVDSGIHLVATAARGDVRTLLDSTTARAVLFSALTTIVSFGSLASSSHRGLASMGLLLTIGLGLMLVSNLVVLPALLVLVPPRRVSDAG